jgi:transcriptional accessory protein Tex/SPT6
MDHSVRGATCAKWPDQAPKAFERAAGFLRVRDGDNPLDANAVRPRAATSSNGWYRT